MSSTKWSVESGVGVVSQSKEAGPKLCVFGRRRGGAIQCEPYRSVGAAGPQHVGCNVQALWVLYYVISGSDGTIHSKPCGCSVIIWLLGRSFQTLYAEGWYD